jgi:hypothetical protein
MGAGELRHGLLLYRRDELDELIPGARRALGIGLKELDYFAGSISLAVDSMSLRIRWISLQPQS